MVQPGADRRGRQDPPAVAGRIVAGPRSRAVGPRSSSLRAAVATFGDRGTVRETGTTLPGSDSGPGACSWKKTRTVIVWGWGVVGPAVGSARR
jgi:hypothetical protein